MKLNQRGQEFSAFRLLVEAVMVVFILTIIMVAIGQIDEIRENVSKRQVLTGFDKAVKSPDGSVIVEENLVLSKGSAYSRRAFSSRVVGLSPECVEITARESPGFLLAGDAAVEMATMVQANVYYQCVTANDAECEIRCTVSFGKEIE